MNNIFTNGKQKRITISFDKNDPCLDNVSEGGKVALKYTGEEFIMILLTEGYRIEFEKTKDPHNIEITASTIESIRNRFNMNTKPVKKTSLANKLIKLTVHIILLCISLLLGIKLANTSFEDAFVKIGLIIGVAVLTATCFIILKPNKEN